VADDGDSGLLVSGRLRLARLAGQVIARTDGISATAGPAGRWQTVGAQQTIPGVLAIEDVRGRVEIELHLVALWPPEMPLEQLGERVRGRLRQAAATAGMGPRLGAVSVSFDDVRDEPAP
jgi:hypothetical protein